MRKNSIVGARRLWSLICDCDHDTYHGKSNVCTGALLLEVIFSLDGLGLLGYESVINRDYPVVLGTLYIFALISLVMHLIRDIVYVMVDPRIDFEARAT